jgi:hypothetical protein
MLKEMPSGWFRHTDEQKELPTRSSRENRRGVR